MARVASLPITRITGDGSGPRDWAAQSYTDVDELISAADGAAAQATDDTHENDTSFQIGNVPSTFSAILTCSWQIRYGVVSRTDDTYGLGIRLVSGATVLAADDAGGTFQIVDSDIRNAAFQNSAITAFNYVNLTADKAAWDAAEVELRQFYAQAGGADGGNVGVDTLQITGTFSKRGAEPAQASATWVAGAAAGVRSQAATQASATWVAGAAAGVRTYLGPSSTVQLASSQSIVQIDGTTTVQVPR